MNQKIFIVDAFTEHPFRGNPAGVVLLEQEMPDTWMQALAAEINLSETAFILMGKKAISLRWFTPAVEVDLCGHATLAAAHVLYLHREFPENEVIHFKTRSGVLDCEMKDGLIWMSFPAFDAVPVKIEDALIKAVQITPKEAYRTGPNLMLIIDSADEVATAIPDLEKIKQMDVQGIILTGRSNVAGVDFVSRYFAPRIGINEDPVTGSSQCSLAPYWKNILGKVEMHAEQVSRRGGYLKLKALEDRVEIGGKAKTIFAGETTI